jgi:seryl-tRNA synthetase
MGIVQDSLEVVKLAGKFANPELVERVTKLNEQVLELSSKNVELQEKVFSLVKELQDAGQKLNLIGNIKRRNGFIYHEGEPEPCCAHCFDTEKVLIRIIEKHDLHSMSGSTPFCPRCKNSFRNAYPEGIRGQVAD